MDTDDLAILIDVARAGSFAAAARARRTDPSTISRTVAALEDRLGARLFQRSTRRMALTEAGEGFVARVAPLVEELDRARAALREAGVRPAGRLRMTASVTFGQEVILPLLPEFRARHPAIAVEAIFTDGLSDLVAERIDLAIRLAAEVEGDLVVSRLMATRYRVVAAADYLRRHGPVATPDDLRAHRIVLWGISPFRDRWLFRPAGGGEVTEVPVAGDLVLSPPIALRTAALAGLGIAMLPDWLVGGDIRAGRLVRLLPDWEVTATSFDTGAYLVYPSRAYLPGKVRAMIDFLRGAVASGAVSSGAVGGGG